MTPPACSTDLMERLVRLEAEVEHLRAVMMPLPNELHDALQRLALFNERIAAHLDQTQRMWDIIEGHTQILNQLQAQQQNTCEFCGQVRKGFWIALTGGVAAVWWFVQRWFEHRGSS